jgi:hypothetical protein
MKMLSVSEEDALIAASKVAPRELFADETASVMLFLEEGGYDTTALLISLLKATFVCMYEMKTGRQGRTLRTCW